MDKGVLYLVGTPIGNLSELSPRAINILKDVKAVFAEDTRVSKKLLFKFEITTTLLSLYNSNYNIKVDEIIDYLNNGEKVAVITDAGMPVISDPGYELVSKIKNDYQVIPVSGPSALINCLVASGLPANPFLFIGFLPRSGRQEILKKYLSFEGTIIFYESPNRLIKTLSDILEIYGNIACCVGKEITKLHEAFYYGTISEVIEKVSDTLLGEFVICVYKNASDVKIELTLSQQINYYLEKGYNLKDAQKLVAREQKTTKREIYNRFLKEKNK